MQGVTSYYWQMYTRTRSANSAKKVKTARFRSVQSSLLPRSSLGFDQSVVDAKEKDRKVLSRLQQQSLSEL